MRRLLAVLLLVAAGCGGALDRVDGALLIQLFGVPENVDEVAIVVRAGGRSFSARLPRSEDVIDEFSAVPVGPATVDVTLYAAGAIVDERLGMTIEIVEGETKPLEVPFGSTIDVRFEVADEHRLYELDVLAVDVEASLPGFSPTVDIHANGVPIVTVQTGTGWSANLDPLSIETIVPFELSLVAEACAEGALCSTAFHTVRVHREVWTDDLGALPAAAPVVDGDRVAMVDESGRLTIADLEDGEAILPPVSLPAPLSVGMAVLDGAVFVADGDENLSRIDLTTGAVDWTIPLGGDRPSDVVVDRDRLIVGAGSRLLAVTATTGDTTVLHTGRASYRARPFVDAEGIVAVDVAGRVVALDANDATSFEASVGEPVRAGPTRAIGRVWVGTLEGNVYAIDRGTVGPALEVEEPVVHPLVVLGSDVVAAAGSSLAYLSTDVERVRLPAPITGAPVPWRGGLLVGLRSGLLTHVGTASNVLSRTNGAALSARPVSDSDVIFMGSEGAAALLRAEEGFAR